MFAMSFTSVGRSNAYTVPPLPPSLPPSLYASEQIQEFMEFRIHFFRERSSVRFKRGRRCMGAVSQRAQRLCAKLLPR